MMFCIIYTHLHSVQQAILIKPVHTFQFVMQKAENINKMLLTHTTGMNIFGQNKHRHISCKKKTQKWQFTMYLTDDSVSNMPLAAYVCAVNWFQLYLYWQCFKTRHGQPVASLHDHAHDARHQLNATMGMGLINKLHKNSGTVYHLHFRTWHDSVCSRLKTRLFSLV